MWSLVVRISEMHHPHCMREQRGKWSQEGLFGQIIDEICVLLNNVKCFRATSKWSSSLICPVFINGRLGWCGLVTEVSPQLPVWVQCNRGAPLNQCSPLQAISLCTWRGHLFGTLKGHLSLEVEYHNLDIIAHSILWSPSQALGLCVDGFTLVRLYQTLQLSL